MIDTCSVEVLQLLPPSYDRLATILLYGKETSKPEEVIRALLSHETSRKLVNDKADGFWGGLSQIAEGISPRGRMTEVDNLDLSHDQQRMKNLSQMQMRCGVLLFSQKKVLKILQGVKTRFGR